MVDIFFLCMLMEENGFYAYCSIICSHLVIRISNPFKAKIIFHLSYIYNASLRQFRELFIVYIGSVKSNQFLIGVSFWNKCKLVMTGCGCELDIAWNILIGKYLCMYFYSTLFLTSLGLRPTPLKTKLENRLIVVESIIFRFFSHLGCPQFRLSE